LRFFFYLFCLITPLLYSNEIAKLRMDDYNDFVRAVSTLPRSVQIERVNSYFNRIVNDYDINIWGKEDYWATPEEFIIRGGGDCEDFVIAKYFTLKRLGFDPSKMMIYIVKVQHERDFHAVLGVQNERNETMILDNLSWKILPIHKRSDLHILYDIQDPNISKNTDPLTQHVRESFQELLSKMNNQQSSGLEKGKR